MSFADNLKETRKLNNMSQEEFAELIGVSRQAVSRWELGDGYPEVEKLIVIAEKLNVSLDYLLLDKEINSKLDEKTVTPIINKSIRINSPTEGIIVEASTVNRSEKFKGSKNSPKYALFASDNSSSLFGPNNKFIGWYKDIDDITKEIDEINQAMEEGSDLYTLKYSVKCKRKWLKIVL